jgi:predicted DNA-binding transcriptional regulator YafY
MEEEAGLVPVTPLRDLGLWRQRFNEFKRYCQEAFALDLQYADPEHGVQDFSIEPYDILERGTRLLLLGLDRSSQEQRLLDLDRIASVRQSPSKNRRSPVQVTVVFALYGRLAKSYRLYPDERLVYASQTEIHVKTRLAETSGLMLRLLKYGASCQILSPDGLRDAMRQHIEGLLSAMEGQPPAGITI